VIRPTTFRDRIKAQEDFMRQPTRDVLHIVVTAALYIAFFAFGFIVGRAVP
jgi:hypothetical protein